MAEKLVVIGGVAAGMSAASKAKRVNPALEVQVYTDDEYISYAGCGLPYFIGDVIPAKQDLIAKTAEQFARQDIAVETSVRAIQIKPADKTVILQRLNNDEIFATSYDRLVIATGARPFVPALKNLDLNGIFTLRTIHDSLNIRRYIAEMQPQKALVVGGGYIGLEMIENLILHGCEVILVERAPHIVPNMDEDMAQIVHDYLESKGVSVLTSTDINGLVGENKIVCAAESSQGNIDCDFVLLSTGVIPNSEIAAEAGLALGVKNAIRVNERMETSADSIYAAGDCAVTYHLLTGQEVYIPMGTTANKQGKIAGENAGGGNARSAGVLGTGIARVLDLEMARTGLSENECTRLGFEVSSRTISAKTAARYYPGAGDIHVKLTVDNNSLRVLGGQIVGFSGAAKRIDTLAASITTGATVKQLIDMDLAYSPPFSPVWDPVLIALNQFA